ncbi:MAG TPA: DUF305 domain-containing protein [Acidobacteriota bacterium]|nr:DUF305 domain-containing protein [Acidobacteriota bacterium]
MANMQSHTIKSQEQFIAEMIPHHQEAVDSARIILNSTQNAELRLLALSIVDTQSSEIEQLKEWMILYHPDSTYVAAYKPMMPNLNALSGIERDRAFLSGMIMHHKMAIMMANQLHSLPGVRADVDTFARNVEDVQSAEIKQMERMLR